MATITTKIGLDAKEFLASLSDVNAKIKTALADNTTKIKVEADTTALKNPLGALPTIEPIKVPIEPIKVPPIEIPINPEKLATEFDTAKSQAIGAAQQIKSALASAFSNGANEKEISKLTEAFKDATKEVDKLTEAEKQAEKAVEGVEKKGSGLKSIFSSALSFAGGSLIAGGIEGAFTGVVEILKEADDAGDRLSVAFSQAKLSGKELSDELSRSDNVASGIADQFALPKTQIQGLQAQVASFGGITGDLNDRLVKVALGASASLGLAPEALAKMIAKSSDPEQAANLSKIGLVFDKNATVAEKLLAVEKKFGPTVEATIASTQDAFGAIDRIKNKSIETIGGALTPILDGIAVLLGGAASVALPIIETLGNGFKNLIGFISENSGVFSFIAGAVGVLAIAMNATAIATALSTAASTVWTTVTTAMASAQGALNLSMLANPIAQVVLAIGALVAILVIAYKNSETFRNIVDKLWVGIKEGFNSLVESVSNFLSGAWAFLQEAFTKIQPLLREIGRLFKDVVGGAVSVVWSGLQTLYNVISTVIGGIIDFVGVIGSWVAGLLGIKSASQSAGGALELLGKAVEFIKSGFTNLRLVLAGVGGVFDSLIVTAKKVINVIRNISFDNIGDSLKRLKNLLFGGVADAVDSAKKAVKDKSKDIKFEIAADNFTDKVDSAGLVEKYNKLIAATKSQAEADKKLAEAKAFLSRTALEYAKGQGLNSIEGDLATALSEQISKLENKKVEASIPKVEVKDKAQVAKKAGAKAGEQAVVDLTDAFKKVFEEGVKINQETKIELTIDPVAKAQAANNNALRNDLQKLADDQQKELDKYIDANNKQQKQVADRYKKALEERNAKLADLNEKSTETDKVKLQAETKKRLDALAKADAELGAANQDVKNLLKGVKTTLTVSVVGEDGIVRLTNQVVEGAKAWELYNQKSGEVAQLKIKNNERKNSILIEEDIYNKYVERINKQRKYEEDYAKISLKLLESQLIKTAEITKQISALKLEALQEQQDKERETFILNTEDYKRRATEIESLFNAGFLTAEQKITSLQNAKYDVEVKLTADKTTQEGRAFSDIITNQKLETRKLSVELGIINSQAVITGLANEVEQTYQQALLNAQKKFDEALKNSGGNKRIVQEATITLNSELYRAEIEKIKAENPKLVLGLEFAETLSEELQKVSKKISEENAKFKVEDKAHEQRIAAIRAERDELIKLYRSGEISANQYHDKVIENTKRLKDELNSSTSGSLGNIGKVLTESLSSTFGVLSAKYGKSADEAFTRVSKANEANITAQERVNKLTAAGKVGTAEYQEALQIQSEASAAATSAQSEAFTKLGISAALGFGEALAAGKNMSEALPLLIFDSLEKAIPSLVALILGQSLAANPIAGLFVSAGLTAALYAAVAVARASLADGAVDIKQGIRTRPDKRDTIPAMLMVGESVITAQGTQARGNLEAFKWVNATGGSLENYFNQPKILMHEVIGMKQAADIAKTNSELQSILAEQNNIIINLHKTNVEQQKLLQGIEHKIAGTQTAIIPPSTDKLHQHYKLEQRKANSL